MCCLRLFTIFVYEISRFRELQIEIEVAFIRIRQRSLGANIARNTRYELSISARKSR